VSFDAASKSGDYVIPIDPMLVRIDANGDGKMEQGESLAGLMSMWSGPSTGSSPPPEVPHQEIGLDRADAFWFAGYTEVIAAQADFLLAHAQRLHDAVDAVSRQPKNSVHTPIHEGLDQHIRSIHCFALPEDGMRESSA